MVIKCRTEELYLMLFECKKFEIAFNETVAKGKPKKCLGFFSQLRCDSPSFMSSIKSYAVAQTSFLEHFTFIYSPST